MRLLLKTGLNFVTTGALVIYHYHFSTSTTNPQSESSLYRLHGCLHHPALIISNSQEKKGIILISWAMHHLREITSRSQNHSFLFPSFESVFTSLFLTSHADRFILQQWRSFLSTLSQGHHPSQMKRGPSVRLGPSLFSFRLSE